MKSLGKWCQSGANTAIFVKTFATRFRLRLAIDIRAATPFDSRPTLTIIAAKRQQRLPLALVRAISTLRLYKLYRRLRYGS